MILENIDITQLSNFKTKAKARYFYKFENNIEELKNVIKFAKKNNLKILAISGWTNMLFGFDTFNGLVIQLKKLILGNENIKIEKYNWFRWNIINSNFYFKDNILEVSWFKKISNIAEILYRENLNKLWMRFIWLPWTIAGAVVGMFWIRNRK